MHTIVTFKLKKVGVYMGKMRIVIRSNIRILHI